LFFFIENHAVELQIITSVVIPVISESPANQLAVSPIGSATSSTQSGRLVIRNGVDMTERQMAKNCGLEFMMDGPSGLPDEVDEEMDDKKWDEVEVSVFED
jgi:hypothetical protein